MNSPKPERSNPVTIDKLTRDDWFHIEELMLAKAERSLDLAQRLKRYFGGVGSGCSLMEAMDAADIAIAARNAAGGRILTEARPAQSPPRLSVEALARQPCTVCGEPIGMGRTFYGSDEAPAHTDCAERDAARGMTWWNGLSREERRVALNEATTELRRSASAADCWRIHLRRQEVLSA
jgi:hypothetical protein